VLPCQGYYTHKGALTGWHGATAERQLGKAKGTSGKTLSIANTFTARFSNVTYE